jgi:hypothetical protein
LTSYHTFESINYHSSPIKENTQCDSFESLASTIKQKFVSNLEESSKSFGKVFAQTQIFIDHLDQIKKREFDFGVEV